MSSAILSRTTLRRAAVTVAGFTAVSVLFTAGAAHAADAVEMRAGSGAEQVDRDGGSLTVEQIVFATSGLGTQAVAEAEGAMASGQPGAEVGPEQRAFPIAAVAIAAAAWCARGAVASIPTSVLSDVADGKFSGQGTYVKNAIIGCLGGEIGGLAWKVLPGWVKNKAVSMVAAFIIKYIR
ncbi:hypothetical protein [Streptomyces sp. NPDC056883]|uniref:hypothetical protein n=1 Tax=Streptomyces sp. NPDC056883 TaxID=3345959 RepID=UPI0036C98CDD